MCVDQFNSKYEGLWNRCVKFSFEEMIEMLMVWYYGDLVDGLLEFMVITGNFLSVSECKSNLIVFFMQI